MQGIERRAKAGLIWFTLLDPERYTSLDHYQSPSAGFREYLQRLLPSEWKVGQEPGTWCQAWLPGYRLPDTGFKIHVSTAHDRALELLERVLPVLVDEQVAFKVLVDEAIPGSRRAIAGRRRPAAHPGAHRGLRAREDGGGRSAGVADGLPPLHDEPAERRLRRVWHCPLPAPRGQDVARSLPRGPPARGLGSGQRALRAEPLCGHARAIAESLVGNYTVFPTNFLGMVGLGGLFVDQHQHTGEEAYRTEALRCVDRVMLFALERPEGLVFPGEELVRVSTDFGTGSAGTGLLLHRLLAGGGVPYFDF